MLLSSLRIHTVCFIVVLNCIESATVDRRLCVSALVAL